MTWKFLGRKTTENNLSKVLGCENKLVCWGKYEVVRHYASPERMIESLLVKKMEDISFT